MLRILVSVFLVMTLSSCDSVMLKAPKVIYESRTKADGIIVDKSDKKLYLLKGGKTIRTYDAHMGSIPGKKTYQDDYKTPEGDYFISNKNPNSKYFLSLAVSYPNKEDLARAKALGKKPGGSIMIHGMPNESSWLERLKDSYDDWTAGCIAVSDKNMVEIYAMVDAGTPITIRP